MLLSIVIPTRNRAELLSDLIESLAQQEAVPFEWEIVIVDNASSDHTAETIKKLQSSLDITIRYFHETRIGLVYGRHRGAEEARGKIIGYLDDDMFLSSTWVQGAEKIIKGQADAVVGRILPHWETPPPGWLQKSAKGGSYSYLGLLDLGPVEKTVEPAFVFGGNCFLPKELIFSLGGFHPDGVPRDQLKFRGDGETGLMVKFKKAGLRSIYDPRATAYHIINANRLTVDYFCRRAFNQGISDSYTRIRADRTQFYWKTILRRVKYVRHKIYRDRIQTKIHRAYWAGYKFHQREVKADPDLYRWVKKDTYIH